MEKMGKIEVDAEILKELTAYCGKENIRFRDFVEDALENAIYRDEIYKAAAETKTMMKEIEQERDKAYRRGFIKGFYAAFCACQGRLGVYAEAGEKIKTKAPFKWVTGPQLPLFQ